VAVALTDAGEVDVDMGGTISSVLDRGEPPQAVDLVARVRRPI
jgi:hypothetical protein